MRANFRSDMSGQKYYWLKLKDDFFGSIRIKKLRRMAGGDTYCIIYLKMQLKAIKTDGVLTYKGYEETFVDELALDLDEEPDNVRVTLAYLASCGLIETQDNTNFFLPYAIKNTGSETSAAERMRKMRERNNVTPMLQERYTEIEKEKDKDKEKDTRDKRFKPPTVEEVRAYCKERRNKVNAEHFVDYYEANGWRVGKNPMRDWKAAIRTWERNETKVKPKIKSSYDDVKIESGDDTDRLAERLGVHG